MSESVAQLQTERASNYLQQLCKHFAHKLPVEFTPTEGTIPFPAGTCRLAAQDGVLTFKLEAADANSLARLQGVVEKHFLRFAFREQIKIEWQAVDRQTD